MSITAKTSNELLRKTFKFYNDEFKKGDGIKSWLHRNITCRAGYFLAFAGSPIASSADLLLGSIAAVGSILTGGLIEPLNLVASTMTVGGGNGLLSGTYVGLIRSINPKAQIGMVETQSGIVSNIVGTYLKDTARELRESDNPFKKHVLSRIVYLGFTLSSVPLRIIDFVLGIFAALGSLVTLGNFKTLNTFALEGLKVASVIHDLYYGIVKTINPWAVT